MTKKLVGNLLSFLLLFSLSGCGNSAQNHETDTDGISSATQQEDSTSAGQSDTVEAEGPGPTSDPAETEQEENMDQTILPFCTSHSSGIGSSADNLHDLCSDTVNWMDGQRFGSGTGEDEYATVMQQFSADRFLGKRVRFAAFVKAQDVDGWAGLWMRLDGRFGVTLKLDNMQNRPIRGTSERLCDRI